MLDSNLVAGSTLEGGVGTSLCLLAFLAEFQVSTAPNKGRAYARLGTHTRVAVTLPDTTSSANLLFPRL
jgi:hypothetical protein